MAINGYLSQGQIVQMKTADWCVYLNFLTGELAEASALLGSLTGKSAQFQEGIVNTIYKAIGHANAKCNGNWFQRNLLSTSVPLPKPIAVTPSSGTNPTAFDSVNNISSMTSNSATLNTSLLTVEHRTTLGKLIAERDAYSAIVNKRIGSASDLNIANSRLASIANTLDNSNPFTPAEKKACNSDCVQCKSDAKTYRDNKLKTTTDVQARIDLYIQYYADLDSCESAISTGNPRNIVGFDTGIPTTPPSVPTTPIFATTPTSNSNTRTLNVRSNVNGTTVQSNIVNGSGTYTFYKDGKKQAIIYMRNFKQVGETTF